MFCVKCGAAIQNEMQFCINCGAKVEQPSGAIEDDVSKSSQQGNSGPEQFTNSVEVNIEDREINPKSKKKLMIWIVAGVLFLICCIAGLSIILPKVSSAPVIVSENGTVYYPVSAVLDRYKENPISANSMWVYIDSAGITELKETDYSYYCTLKKISGVTVTGRTEKDDVTKNAIEALSMKDLISLRGKITSIETNKRRAITGITVELYYIENLNSGKAVFYPGY